jgi:hypothetical protein
VFSSTIVPVALVIGLACFAHLIVFDFCKALRGLVKQVLDDMTKDMTTTMMMMITGLHERINYFWSRARSFVRFGFK